MHRAITPTPDHDVFWIFSLWRALHGGDPTLAEVAASAIASLAQFLPSHEGSFGLPPLPVSSRSLAPSEDEDCELDDSEILADQTQQPQEPPAFICPDQCEFSIHHYYFRFKGVFYRLDRPVYAGLPTAA